MRRGSYKDADAFYMGRGVSKFPKKYKGRFDLCTASGVFLPNHMPPSAFEDCHAVLKKGGLFVTAVRKALWAPGEKHGFRDKLDKMFAKGNFKVVGTKEFKRGHKDRIALFAQ